MSIKKIILFSVIAFVIGSGFFLLSPETVEAQQNCQATGSATIGTTQVAVCGGSCPGTDVCQRTIDNQSCTCAPLGNTTTNSQRTNIKLFGKFVGCDPSFPPNKGGCGIPQFIRLIKNLITYLTIIVIPIGVAVIVWGGILIMTAAGSPDRVGKGKKVITAAVIGIAIALGSWLIINAIFLALSGGGVDSTLQNIN